MFHKLEKYVLAFFTVLDLTNHINALVLYFVKHIDMMLFLTFSCFTALCV